MVPFVKPKDRQRLHRGHQHLWKCLLYTLGLTTHPKPLVHKGMTNLCTFLVAHCNGCLELTIGRADFNTSCFLINGQSISTKLDRSTDAAKIRVACRTVARQDEPQHITTARGPGIEIDHQNEGGFAKIVNTFIELHGEETIMKHVGRVVGAARETLNEPLRSEFVQLHREMTSNYTECVPLAVEEHRRLTRERLGI